LLLLLQLLLEKLVGDVLDRASVLEDATGRHLEKLVIMDLVKLHLLIFSRCAIGLIFASTVEPSLTP
jgi:hypothetical protein